MIIKRLRRVPATLREIQDYLGLESELQGYDYRISARTFQRDLEDIRSLYDIDIQYDHSIRAYRIVHRQQAELTERILEAFDTFNALNIRDRLSDHIHFETRRPQGTEHLYGLLHAIRNNVRVVFTYQKFLDDEISIRTVEPYILKEFRDRWYLIGKDINDQNIKSFGLDRLTDLEISKKSFMFPENFDPAEHFRYSFGIMSPNADAPSDIILSFEPLQGKYIKTMPLHHTQEIIADNEQELRIKLRLYITHDFVMELLSYGDGVEVIDPEGLREEIVAIYHRAMGRE